MESPVLRSGIPLCQGARLLHVGQTLVAEIGVVEVGVVPFLGQETLVIPLFDDAAFLQHDDAVGCPDGGEAMGDQDAGGVFQDQIQGLLDLPLGEGVDAGGGPELAGG